MSTARKCHPVTRVTHPYKGCDAVTGDMPSSIDDSPLGGIKMPNPIGAELLSGPERIAAVCEILAAGLVRLQARQSRGISLRRAENFLDCGVEESGHRLKPLRKVQQ